LEGSLFELPDLSNGFSEATSVTVELAGCNVAVGSTAGADTLLEFSPWSVR
jgi:hypothetical protein